MQIYYLKLVNMYKFAHERKNVKNVKFWEIKRLSFGEES
jgi:hypothetical protein